MGLIVLMLNVLVLNSIYLKCFFWIYLKLKILKNLFLFRMIHYYIYKPLPFKGHSSIDEE